MSIPKIPRAGQSVMPLQKHTVKNPQGKVYSYRGHQIKFWFSEDEIKLLEIAYNHIKATKHPDFSDKELSTLPKFLKAYIVKSFKRIKRKYVDESG